MQIWISVMWGNQPCKDPGRGESRCKIPKSRASLVSSRSQGEGESEYLIKGQKTTRDQITWLCALLFFIYQQGRLIFIASAMRSHWRILSQRMEFHLCFWKIALAAVWRAWVESGGYLESSWHHSGQRWWRLGLRWRCR